MKAPLPTPPSEARGHVLAVAYYFPPIDVVGTQRTLAFVRELRPLGWRASALTVSNPQAFRVDEALLDQLPGDCRVYRSTNLEPFETYHAIKNRLRRLRGQEALPHQLPAILSASGERTRPHGFFRRVLSYLSWYLATPDKMVGWTPFAVARGAWALREDRPEVIYSSGPPHTCHLIAGSLARLWNCAWVADFRDPWVDNPFVTIPVPSIARWSTWLERWAVTRADRVICNTPAVERAFQSRYTDQPRDKFVTITNGYSPRDFEGLPAWCPEPGRLRIAYTGAIYGKRSPESLIRVLARWMATRPEDAREIELVFAGVAENQATLERLIREGGLEGQVRFLGTVSSRRSLEILAESDLQLMLGPQGEEAELQVPGKLFTYFGVGRPVFSLSKRGGVIQEILERSGVEYYQAEPGDESDIEQALERALAAARRGTLGRERRELSLREFEHPSLAERLSEVFDAAIDVRRGRSDSWPPAPEPDGRS
ncbi:MAG: glycosyltransferase family 4 protein [Planctomycetota bacterium]